MFSDVAGSTAIYESLGDRDAERCIGVSLNMMCRIVKANSGQVVKTIGDEIMARFVKPDDAYLAAKQIQEQSGNILVNDFNSVQIRIGMHTGAVIEKENDIFGDAVNTAARMTEIAKAGQIIISEDLFLQLDKSKQSSARLFDRARVKGKGKALSIYQIVWEDINQTNIITNHDGASIASAKGGLVLVYKGKGTFIPNKEAAKAFTIGRDATCTLMINSDYASRLHLEIAWQRDKFILTDRSTNGTTVTLESGTSIFLKRESYPLIGKGSFTLGVDGKHVVSFDLLKSD